MSYCPKCNSQLDKEPYLTKDGWMCYDCPQCNSAYYLPATQPHYTPEPQDEEGSSAVYIIIFLVCTMISITLIGLHSRNINMFIIFFIGALVAIITGFIKHPRNRVIQVLFWLTIALVTLMVIAVIIFIIACINIYGDYIDFINTYGDYIDFLP